MSIESGSADIWNGLFAEAVCRFRSDPRKIVEYINEIVDNLDEIKQNELKNFLRLTWDTQTRGTCACIVN